MSAPGLHRVTYRRGHTRGSFTTWSEEDALYVKSRYEASGFEVDIDPVAQPEIPEGLRPFDEQEAA